LPERDRGEMSIPGTGVPSVGRTVDLRAKCREIGRSDVLRLRSNSRTLVRRIGEREESYE